MFFRGTVDDVVRELQPTAPLYITRPDFFGEEVAHFVKSFPGETVYAVKCNTDKAVLSVMHKAGVKSFDVASLEEIRLIRKLAPKAKLYWRTQSNQLNPFVKHTSHMAFVHL